MAKKVTKEDIEKSPRYRSEYPCCGQSRFEPVKRTAIDGRVWWCACDHKNGRYIFGKHKTRRDCVLSLYMDFRHDRLPFEPDEKGKDLEWLKGLTSLDQAMCRATKGVSKVRSSSTARATAS